MGWVLFGYVCLAGNLATLMLNLGNERFDLAAISIVGATLSVAFIHIRDRAL